MKTFDIFKELGVYLTPFHVELLKLNFCIPSSVLLTMSVAQVVKEYDGLETEDEKRVCILLVQLMKNYYRKA